MCNYCNEDKLNTLIEKEEISSMFYFCLGHKIEAEDIIKLDNSVVLDIRNKQGYIRLGDREDMNCIDTEYKLKINYCPVCGRKLGTEEDIIIK